jgi:dTDP-4-amino-4,6-dideoxy-D-galactose acyltransferase
MKDIAQLDMLFESRKRKLFYYSPYSFLRNSPADTLYRYSVKEPLLKKIHNNDIQIITIRQAQKPFLFLVEYLAWDSNYFGFPTYKLHTVLFDQEDRLQLPDAVASFKSGFFNEKGKYCFTDIPSEDILLLQAFSGAGFKLIETRMTYYLDLTKHDQERFSVREAKREDIQNLRRVANEMRNPFDRFHADTIFDPARADEFLATFVEESVNGFADYTMVPNEPGTPPDAFLTAKFLREDWPVINAKVSKMVLSAVSSKTCKGWYKKLISEMAYYLHSQGADFAFMHPASTNKAVIHTYETLGCRLGQVSHIFSFS